MSRTLALITGASSGIGAAYARLLAAASLAGLRPGETVCVPGLEEGADALDALLAAETALQHGGNQPSPASRYRQPLSR